jgi:hypothetical protein
MTVRGEVDREDSTPAPTRTPDPEGLLCGLVLAPDTWSRNRMFALYEDPRARRARRRAQHVRSVVALLRRRGGDLRAVVPPAEPDRVSDVELVIDVPEMNLVRRTRLSPLELSLVRYVLRVGEPAEQAGDRHRVEQALGRLMIALS